MSRPLSRAFYNRPATTVAPELLGLHLVRRHQGLRSVTRIVEVEAYEGPDDLAAHSARGRRTARTEVMFGRPGRAYVYLIYGMHHCLNVVTAPADIPHAVLLRAVEPVKNVHERTQGPGLICKALHIDRSLNDHDLKSGALSIERPAQFRAPRIETAERIGIAYAGTWAKKKWRYLDADSRFLSRKA